MARPTYDPVTMQPWPSVHTVGALPLSAAFKRPPPPHRRLHCHILTHPLECAICQGRVCRPIASPESAAAGHAPSASQIPYPLMHCHNQGVGWGSTCPVPTQPPFPPENRAQPLGPLYPPAGKAACVADPPTYPTLATALSQSSHGYIASIDSPLTCCQASCYRQRD